MDKPLIPEQRVSLNKLTAAHELLAELKNLQGNPVLAQAIAPFRAASLGKYQLHVPEIFCVKERGMPHLTKRPTT
jgi:hypothetical protein